MNPRCRLWVRLLPAFGVAFSLGCTTSRVEIPSGHLPPVVGSLDSHTSASLNSSSLSRPISIPSADKSNSQNQKKDAFDLPPALPGSDRPPVVVPRLTKDMSPAEREKAVRAAYPELKPISISMSGEKGASPLSLADFQQLAFANSPAIRQATADADAAFGQVIQVGLCPNPTVGYEADQWQPGSQPRPINNSGQQGGYVNLLIKTVGKLSLAQQVAGYDYINALVAVRRAQIDVSTQIRTAYFAAIVAQRSVEMNRSLCDMADEIYRFQLKRLIQGDVVEYEPLPLYAQAIQYRNAVIQAEAAYRAAGKQLAILAGQMDVPFATIAGRAETAAPTFQRDDLLQQLRERHTDVLSAQNALCKAQTNLMLQKRIPIPDLQTTNYQQYDNVAKKYQFGLQLGVALPLFDRNQGNIRSAIAQIASAGEKIRATQNDLSGKYAEAFSRYESNRLIAENFRDRVLPPMTQAYASLIQRFPLEPEKVSFNDVIAAQQSLAQAMQSYLTALGSQWQAVVDVANLSQLDELFFTEQTQAIQGENEKRIK